MKAHPWRPIVLLAGLGALTLCDRGASQVSKNGPQVQELPASAPAWLEGYRVRWPLRVVGDPAKQTNQTVVARLPSGSWLKPGAADVAVQTASGQTLPLRILSHDPNGDTLIQFKRNGNDAWYWAYGVCEKPLPQAKIEPAPQEGMTLELREWAGDDLGSWAKVREGLGKSDNVIGNGLACEVVQNCNPARPDRPQSFAASYRGYLDIKKDGVYQFYVNSDDAAFLFIDGFKVFERPGANEASHQFQKDFAAKAGKIELKAGVHPVEVHHVVGNNGRAQGICVLAWQPPGEKKAYVPRSAFAQGMLAQPAAVEGAGGAPAASFEYGIDDSLSSGDVRLCLVRFAAQGDVKDEKSLVWDFGDGSTGTGRSVTHVYLKDGDYKVSLQSASGLPPYRRTVTVWPVFGTTSPLSPGAAVRAIAASEWKKWPPDRVRQLYAFLKTCEQPERWAVLEQVTAHLLAQKELELEDRTDLIVVQMGALAHTGNARKALKLGEEADKKVTKGSGLQLGIKLAIAEIHQYQTKEPAQASAMYKAMLDEFKGVEHPYLRTAAIRWGDMLADAGDLPEAAKAYQLANTLGGDRFKASQAKGALVNAAERGAKLRIVDKILKEGNIHQARVLLGQIEVDFPEQKLEGLYRFLRAEADRHGGHYEEAIRNYEILVRLQQWAGYRSRALSGIADSYNRMGQLEKALEWYDRLRQTDSVYYAKEKMATRRELIEARLRRAKEAGDGGALFLTGHHISFEPDRKEPTAKLNRNLFPTRGLSLDGPHVALFDALNVKDRESFLYMVPVQDLNPEGWYWVEFWVRETLGSFNVGTHQKVGCWIAPKGDTNPYHPRNGMTDLDRTYGQWRKLGFKFKGPAAHEGDFVLDFRNYNGVVEVDGLRVQPITDQQNDLLISFLEGGTEKP